MVLATAHRKLHDPIFTRTAAGEFYVELQRMLLAINREGFCGDRLAIDDDLDQPLAPFDEVG